MDLSLGILSAHLLDTPVWLWVAFFSIVLALLVFDLGILNRKDHVIGIRESLCLSTAYIAVALAFGAGVWWTLGTESAMEYLTGFVVEKTLAMDNVFVIAMVFTYFAVPREFQHRVLFWGVLGVIVLRALMIGFGTALITSFHWVLYLFGAFLIATGIKMLVLADHQLDIERNPVLRLLRRKLRVTKQPHGNRFWVRLAAPDRMGGPPSDCIDAPLVWWATPLFLALVVIEVVDVIFAIDSVPAIFAITQDPFIVYTSNIFAILGLRALYFTLAAMIERFAYLKYSLAIVLVFIGSEIFLVNVVGKMPAWISLSVTVSLLAAGMLYSLYRTREAPRQITQG